jgi:hypothetical protein
LAQNEELKKNAIDAQRELTDGKIAQAALIQKLKAQVGLAFAPAIILLFSIYTAPFVDLGMGADVDGGAFLAGG